MQLVRPGLILLALTSTVQAQRPAAENRVTRPARVTTAFVDVNVITMQSPSILFRQTVIVEGGRIVRIGAAATVPIPGEATVIRGEGRAFMMPGLVDMHTHAVDSLSMRDFLAAGVTTILDNGYAPGDATPGFADTAFVASGRRAYAAGVMPGPRVFAAFMIDGPQWSRGVHNEVELAIKLGIARRNGYEFLKLHGGFDGTLEPAVFRAAQSEHMPVVGHLPRNMPLDSMLAGLTMIAHVEEFLYTVFSDSLDQSRLPDLIRELRKAGTFVTTTLSTYQTIATLWGRPAALDSILALPMTTAPSAQLLKFWRSAPYGRLQGSREREAAFLCRVIRALHEGGVPLLAGTDAPVIPGMPAGVSLHGELRALVGAGLSPFDAIRTATITPNQFISRHVPGAEQFGIVVEGARADLLVLEGNPLAGLEALDRMVGVMHGGVWRTTASLATRP